MPCRVAVSLDDGESVMIAKQDYEGFHSRPMRWESVVQKFEQLSTRYADAALRREIIEAVSHLDTIRVTDLTHRLAKVRKNQPRAGSHRQIVRHVS
jgi:2-methylcitrate dehydratase